MKFKKIIYDEDALTLIIAVMTGILILSLGFQFFYEKQESAEIILLTGCGDCFDMNELIPKLIKEQDIYFKDTQEVDYQSKKGQELIKKYNVRKIPALIIKSRDIEKISLKIFEKNQVLIKKDYILFEGGVPYIDLFTEEKRGFVNLIEIQESSCSECESYFSFIKQLEEAGMKKENLLFLDSNSEQGKKLIKENNIQSLPALLTDKEFKEYWWITKAIGGNIEEKKDYLLFTNKVYPYFDLNTKEIKGKVKATYLINQSCEDCFNPAELGNAFKQLGVYIGSEEKIDLSDSAGRLLIKKYNITSIPTIILSKEINDYFGMKKLLNQIGTIENDGAFIFRNLKATKQKYQEGKWI